MADDVRPSAYYEPAVGRLEDALAMVGTTVGPLAAQVPVEWGQVRAFAAMIEDPDPRFWSPSEADEVWGGIVAPAAILAALFAPPHWQPAYLAYTVPLSLMVPLPGPSAINVATTATFARPLRLGEWITMTESLISVSPERETRLGVGHFVLTRATYATTAGEHVSECENTMLRFSPAGQEGQL